MGHGKARKLVAAIVTIAAVTPVLAPAPANAASAAALVFVGKESLSGAICWSFTKPILGCAFAPGGKVAVGAGLFVPNPNFGALCIGVSATSKKTPPVEGPACSIMMGGMMGAVGGLGPWCDLNAGFGVTGTATVGGKTYNLTGGSWIQIGTTRLATGTASKGNQIGTWVYLAEVVNDLVAKGHSCVPGATRFIVSGVMSIQIIGNK